MVESFYMIQEQGGLPISLTLSIKKHQTSANQGETSDIYCKVFEKNYNLW